MKYITLLLSLSSCIPIQKNQVQTSNVKSIPDDIKASISGLFECNSGLTFCKITKNVLAPPTGISATWEITYDFPCLTGGQTFDSPIEIRLGNNHRRLIFGKVSEKVIVDGDGGLTLVDTDPPLTNSWFFDYGHGCGLAVSYKITPSLQQVGAWSETADTYTSILKSNSKIYGYKPQVKDWYEKNISNPGQQSAILNQIVAALRPLADTDEVIKTYIKSLEDILNGAPSISVFGPYDTAQDTLREILPKAQNLQNTMRNWNASIKTSFVDSITDAARALEL